MSIGTDFFVILSAKVIDVDEEMLEGRDVVCEIDLLQEGLERIKASLGVLYADLQVWQGFDEAFGVVIFFIDVIAHG